VLYKWISQAEKDIPNSADIIWAKAQFYWSRMSLYRKKEMPLFSNEWLYKFQSQHTIKLHKLHGEAGNVQENASQAMILICQALANYSPKDIFNCDESALFWKLRLYEEQQDEGYQPILCEFDQFEQILLARRVNNAVQKDI